MASVLPSCNTSDVMAQLANVTSPPDDVYDHEGAMEFIVATLLVYCLIGIAGLLVMKIRRRASMGQRTVTMREEHIQSYIKQADDLRLAGYRDKLKIEAKRMMYYIESIERRKSEAGSVMEVTTFLEDSSTQTSPLTIAEEPSFTIPEEPSFTIAEEPSFTIAEEPSFTIPEEPSFTIPEEPSFTIAEEPSFTIAEEPSFTIAEEPSFTIAEEPSFNLPTQQFLTCPDFDTSPPNIGRDVRSCGFKTHLSSSAPLTTYEVPDISTNNLTNNVPAHVTNVPAHVTNVPAHVTNVPANVTNVPAHVTNVPAHVTNVPAHVTNVPAHVTNNLTTERPATQEDRCVQEDSEDNNDEHMSLI